MSLKLITTVDDTKKHEYDVTSLIFKNNKLYSSADDGKIKMWSIDLKLEKEVQAHPCSIYSLTADNSNQIYSCSSDGSIRAWKADTLQESFVVQQPGPQEMWKIYWDDGMLAVADDQGMITLFKDGKLYSTVEMLEQIKDIAFKENLLYTVRDLDLVITEVLTGEKHKYTCRNTLSGRAPLFLLGDILCFSSRDGRGVLVHHRKEKQFSEIAKIEGAHELMINTIHGYTKGSEYLILSAGWDKIIKQWRFSNGQISPAGTCDLGNYINVLCVDDKGSCIFAGGADGKIWKISTN